MFSFLKSKAKTVSSTPFSEFIRNAKSGEKKRVYKMVIEKASAEQNRLLEQAKLAS